MWRSILGERKIGKSAFLEKILSDQENTLYIATLPDIKKYSDTISAHRRRRPAAWRCIELFDMTLPEILSFPYLDFKQVMLDNLSYYLLFHIMNDDRLFQLDQTEAYFGLIRRLAEDRTTTAYFVDSPLRRPELSQINKLFLYHALNPILESSQSIQWFGAGETLEDVDAESATFRLFSGMMEEMSIRRGNPFGGG